MALPFLAASIAAPLIGGLFSSNANKRQNKANQKQAQHERAVALEDDATRFTRVRDGAIAAGFNPLTALQFGGTTTGFGSGRVANQVFDWGPTAAAIAQAAMPEITGQADVARQREVLEQDLLKVQADAMRAQTAATSQALSAAQAFRPIGGTASGSAGGSAAGPAVAASGSAYSTGQLATNREVREITYRGNQFQTDPYTDDVDQSLEPRYGDIVSSVGGIGVLGADIYHNLKDVPLFAPSFGEMFSVSPDGFAARLGRGISSALGTNTVDNVTVHRQQSTPTQFMYPSGSLLRSGLAY